VRLFRQRSVVASLCGATLLIKSGPAGKATAIAKVGIQLGAQPNSSSAADELARTSANCFPSRWCGADNRIG
jgi:hypothetical protein